MAKPLITKRRPKWHMAKPLITKRRPNLIHAALLPYKTLQGFSGSTNKDPRSFDVLVDGERIATQTLEIHSGELFDFEYPLPEQLTRGKERITMKFQSLLNAMAGSVFDVRVAQLERGEK